MSEFDGVRAELYKKALHDFPLARKGDITLMKKHLAPKQGDFILEVGAGNGMFSGTIADAVLPGGKLIVSDPSKEQLAGVEALKKKNIEIIQKSAEDLSLEENQFNAIWSFGAVHHIEDKEKVFKNFKRMLKPNGRLVMGDVFQGSTLAEHFDTQVAKYCATGHDVVFLTEQSLEELCKQAGLGSPQIIDFNARWEFRKKEGIGEFLYDLHAMTKTTKEECLRGAEEILGIEEEGGRHYLNWPMKMVVTRKV